MHKVLFILEALRDTDIEWLVQHGSRLLLKDSAVLIEEDAAQEALYIVLSGRLKVTCRGLEGEALAYLGKGEIVGELSFLDSHRSSATVVATEGTELFVIPKAELSAHLQTEPRFAAGFYKALGTFLARRLRDTVQLLAYYRGDLADQEEHELDFEADLDPQHLQSLTQAGRRFEQMIEQLRRTEEKASDEE